MRWRIGVTRFLDDCVLEQVQRAAEDVRQVGTLHRQECRVPGCIFAAHWRSLFSPLLQCHLLCGRVCAGICAWKVDQTHSRNVLRGFSLPSLSAGRWFCLAKAPC